MKIGDVSKKAGVNVQTLRYYERVGILTPKSRLESGYRIYDETAIQMIRFIKHAQELGFSLDEIQGLLGLRADKKSKCERVQNRAVEHLMSVERKIKRLEAIQSALKSLIKNCKQRRIDSGCPLLECLEEESFELGSAGAG
jgi:MerR family transcriptional regulator, copper efflux regulator